MGRLPLVPFPPIDERAGGISPQFDMSVRYEFHPPIRRFKPSDIGVPALVMAGWHDLFLQPDLDLYTSLKEVAPTDEARSLTRLAFSAWCHDMVLITVRGVDTVLMASSLLRQT